MNKSSHKTNPVNFHSPSGFLHGCSRLEVVITALIIVLATSLTLPALQQARQQSRNTLCKDRLRNLGLALHNYQDIHRVLPPGWVSRVPHGKGHPSTGWQPFTLPFMGHTQLYNQLDMKEPIYAPRKSGALSVDQTRKILQKSLGVYRCPIEPDLESNPFHGGWGTSNYMGNFGATALPQWSDLESIQGGFSTATSQNKEKFNGIFDVNSKRKFRDITDGTSNTIMVGERSVITRAGIWTGPRSNHLASDVVSDGSFASKLNASPTGFSSRHPGGIHFLFVDGTVRFLSTKIESKPSRLDKPEEWGILQKLSSCNDGQMIRKF